MNQSARPVSAVRPEVRPLVRRLTHHGIRSISILVLAALCAAAAGCGNREVKELQSTVDSLQSKLSQYQQSTSQETQETNQTLGSMNQTLNNRFQELQFTQGNLQSTLQQMANQISALEQNVDKLQQRVSRLESFSTETATLTQDLNRSTASIQNTLNDQVKTLQSSIQTLRADFDALQTESRRGDQDSAGKIQAAQAQLDKRITTIESNNRAVYEKILKELGASVPDSVQPSQPTTSGGQGGGGTYVVKGGDTLSKIASQFGVSMQAIQDANGIDDPSKIYPNQTLKIPQP